MKTLKVLIAIAGLAWSSSTVAPAQNSLGHNGLDDPAPSSAQSNAVTDRYLTNVQTELTGSVDAKNAAPGQAVTARVRQEVRLADGTTLPKGTKLVGHVTGVQAPDKNSGRAGSLLAVNFDHAELKSGQSLPLRCVMRGIAPPMGASMRDGSTANQPMMTGVPNVSGTAGGLGGANGGMGGPVRAAGQPAGSIGRTSGRTVGTPAPDATPALDSISPAQGGAVVSAGETLSTAPRATALPGVLLSTTASADASGTLIAPGSDISLQSGTQITLGVITR